MVHVASIMGSREFLIPCLLLCSFGFFKETLPSEPFLTPYLAQYKNISEEAITNQIYPTWTYSYMVALIPVFLFTDILRYKPVIIFEGCSFLATYSLLLWASSIPLMRLMQMFYALATAAEIAYYSYIYAVVPKKLYQQVSSYTRSAVLMGNFVAGVFGQLLYSFSKNDDDNILYHLHVISMSSIALATTLSLFLPKTDSSTYFHRRTKRRGAKDNVNCNIQMVENGGNDEADRKASENDKDTANEHDTEAMESKNLQTATHNIKSTEDGTSANNSREQLPLLKENISQVADLDIVERNNLSQSDETEIQSAENIHIVENNLSEIDDCTEPEENCAKELKSMSSSREATKQEATKQTSVIVHDSKLSVTIINQDSETRRTCAGSSLPNQVPKDDANSWGAKLTVIWSDFRTSYQNKELLKWSLWWAFATCGAHQVSNFVQTLWQVFVSQTDGDEDIVYNGAVIGASTLAGAVAAFCIMFSKLNWDIFGEIFIGIVSIFDSVLLVTMATTKSIWLCYAFYIVFRASYQLVKTIATYQIAKHLTAQHYGLVFGCNTFVAAVLQSILTLIVVDHKTLSASPRLQFVIYGGCFFLLGVLFCCKAVYTMTIDGWKWSWRNRYGVTSEEDEMDNKAGVKAGEEGETKG